MTAKPYRVRWNAVGPVSEETLRENVRAALKSEFPLVQRRPVRRLAVVGGGPSVAEHLNELAQFDGEIWGINQTAQYLLDHEINCTLFVIDPSEEIAAHTVGVEKALVASICHPKVFEGLKGKDVRIFHVDPYNAGKGLCVIGGPSAATRAPMLAAAMGYEEVTWYGCEGCFSDQTHAYRDEPQFDRQLIVKAGGKHYRTRPDLLLTSEYLADTIVKFPGVFFEKSGGLLRAIIEHRDSWSTVALSDSLRDELDPTSTERFDVSLCA